MTGSSSTKSRNAPMISRNETGSAVVLLALFRVALSTRRCRNCSISSKFSEARSGSLCHEGCDAERHFDRTDQSKHAQIVQNPSYETQCRENIGRGELVYANSVPVFATGLLVIESLRKTG